LYTWHEAINVFCEKCKSNEATIHLSEIIKDVKSEIHLCEKCARDIGFNSKLSNFTLSIPEMLSFLDLSEVEDSVDVEVCPNCGMSYLDYSRTGRLGCPECYDRFRESITSVIISRNGESAHAGKYPARHVRDEVPMIEKSAVSLRSRSLSELNDRLRKAVSEERYEDAAILRDEINELVKN